MRVQNKSCATCIYRKDSALAEDLPRLEAEVKDQYGHFNGFRICHHSADACCRGFFNKHKQNCTPLQISERLGIIEFVEDDNLN